MEVTNYPPCQSCGMPMTQSESYGTGEDGKQSSDYCKFCYQNGKFNEPNVTKEQMIERVSKFMVEKMKAPEEKAKEVVPKVISSLKRWKEPAKQQPDNLPPPEKQ